MLKHKFYATTKDKGVFIAVATGIGNVLQVGLNSKPARELGFIEKLDCCFGIIFIVRTVAEI
ncbi:MAG: hypothetical protein NTX06_12225 [Proteobacteria bacterium]|nr:hypothetical protein [Pseudomonadota bacterium]